MGHINLKLNIKALPGAKYIPVKGYDKPCIIIPNDPEIFEQDSKYDAIIMPVMLWQQPTDTTKQNNPTHRAKLVLTDEVRAKRKREMLEYLEKLTDEKYTAFVIDTFQNKEGTAKLPQTREEAAAWYCSRKDELGAAWEQKPQALKAAGTPVEIIPAGTQAEQSEFGEDDEAPF